MAEILKDWLSQTLERPVTWEAEEFGNMMKNGHVIATVLRSYHVINDEKHYIIRASNEQADIKNNWKYLREWLKEVEVNLTDEDLNNVMMGKGSSLLRLFYQLFLHLDKRDRINFIKRERKMVSSLVEKLENRFTVKKVTEERDPFVDYLSKPLLDERQFIEWQKRKAKEIKESYDYLNHKYSKVISKIEESKIQKPFVKKGSNQIPKTNEDIDKFERQHPCKYRNYTYEELMALEEKALQRKKSLVDSDWANEYMNNLFHKIRKRSDSEEFQRQVASALSNSLWNTCVAEEESKGDMALAKKVMKLSQFEKQMCTQIMETKQQARNLVKNRIQGEIEYTEQREQQLNIFFDNLKDKIDSGIIEIDFEQKRQNQLHRRLYAEKMRRKRQIYYEICYETILALIDYAVKIGYFKKLMEDDVPQRFIHEWKCLFFKQQPIFEILVPTEDILKLSEVEEESSSTSFEEVVYIERDRQQVLNDCELQEYLDYLYPWNLDVLIPNYDPESEERIEENLGLKILGHAVYTLLEVKYPYPSKRLPADLPDYTSKVLLRSLPDKSLSSLIETLLNSQKIRVVRLESVINYCLREYQFDMIGRAEIQLTYDSFIAATQEEETKELIKSMKSEEEELVRSHEVDTSGPLLSPLPNTKYTQTPKSLPEDEMIMSPAASLGQYAYDALTVGEPLTDYLLAAMIVEYLKNQEDIVGFVIINYPNTYLQLQILEEAFVGIGPPDFEELNDNDDELLEESILKHRLKELDVYKEVRMSKIVKDPHKKRIDKPFETYFTAYINLKQTIDISDELVIWELNQENSDIIDRFYAVMGINYSLLYEVIDRDLIAQICKFVVGDFSIPIKSFEELFDENVLNQVDFPNSDVKHTNSKIVKSDIVNNKSKEKVRRNSKMSRTTIETELEIIKAPLSFGDVEQNRIKTLESMIAQENKSKSLYSVDKIKVLPGEEDWEYGVLPISETLGVSLTSYWEEFEKSYIDSVHQMFFTTRLQMNYVIPYTRFLKDKMMQIITLPSEKQNILADFHKSYNDFENDWRPLSVARNEWHCRVKELQNKLYNICDQRKLFAEEKRRALICDNWTIEELTILANTYISLMQMELNRSIISFQIMNDFYLTMLRGAPSSDRLASKDLTKIYRETDTHSNKKGGDEKLFKHLKAVFQEFYINNIEFDFDNNPFNPTIENNAKFAMKIVKDLGESFRTLISKEYTEKAKITPTKKKEGNGSTESCNQEEILKENVLKCLEEWPVGVNGEMLRFNLRVLALQYKCYADMKLLSDQVFKAFTEIQNLINTYYANEVLAVDRLCKYFHMAIEKGRKIPESLLLEYDTLIIDNNVLQFAPSVQNIIPQSKSEIKYYSYFKTNQLARLRSQFKLVAPTGIIMHKAFIYLLQDFIIFGKENREGPLLPNVWKTIDPEQVQKLVSSIFGETAYVDWREFLIYCLQLSFPTIQELLQVRKKFRCNDLDSTELISRDNFIKEELWFDKDFVTEDDKQDLLKLNLVKHFLFELYETEQDMMNYPAFLLAFCKSTDPIIGFIAALSMAVGQEVCHSWEDCGDIVTYLINDKKYRDECLACALKCTEQFINKLIHRVVSICEGTTVEEVMYTESVPEEKKSKGKRKYTKVKKFDGNQSGRSDNSQKRGSQYKMTPSIVPSQAGMICPPCEKPVEKPKEPEKEPVVVKPPVEQPPVPYRDPNICLDVSQAVIWNVLKICLPWHFEILPEATESLYVRQVEEALKTLETDTDNKNIYVCKLVADPNFCKILHKVKKFTVVDLLEEIITMI